VSKNGDIYKGHFTAGKKNGTFYVLTKATGATTTKDFVKGRPK
jgi:hypothetical protein